MQFKDFFLREFDREMPVTRKMLERVPEDKFDWKPHAKSSSLGNLAVHISTLTGFAVGIVNSDSIDLAGWKQPEIATREELLATFDDLSIQARSAIDSLSEEDFEKSWALKVGERTIMELPKADVLQSIYLSHIFHHRAQLGVYLRLLDIPVPGTYGPSADDQ